MSLRGTKSHARKLESAELLKRLAELPLRYTFHALERLAERKILETSVTQMLRGKAGRRVHVAAKDRMEAGSWKYRIHGRDVDGEMMGAIVAVEEEVIVITAFFVGEE